MGSLFYFIDFMFRDQVLTYPSNVLGHTAKDGEAAWNLCQNDDDIMALLIGSMNGSTYKTRARS
jgi:hypothetical protein